MSRWRLLAVWRSFPRTSIWPRICFSSWRISSSCCTSSSAGFDDARDFSESSIRARREPSSSMRRPWSTICLRATSSSKSPAAAAEGPNRTAATIIAAASFPPYPLTCHPPRVDRAPPQRSLVDPRVEDIAAAILRPAGFRRLGAPRLLFAEAHGFDLVLPYAQDLHHLLHGIGPALPEREVVLAAAALVGVALDAHLGGAVLLQVARVGRHDRLVLVLDEVAVVIEEDAALGEDALRI